jgi:Uma2 family endonuclease
MNIHLPRHMEKADFLAWVQGREERYELDRGRVVMMTGGSRGHWQLTFNLCKLLDARLDPKLYNVLPEFGVDIGPATLRFPDVVVDIAGQPMRDLTAKAPVFIAEVLSPSSERVDLGDKAAEYLHLPTLANYLVLAQDEVRAWMWTRATGGFPGGPMVHDGADSFFSIPALGITLSLAEIYQRVRME